MFTESNNNDSTFTKNNRGVFVSKILFDEKDRELYENNSWNIVNSGRNQYLIRTVTKDGKKTSIKFHREIMRVTDPQSCVDHINGNGLDNRRANLRVIKKKHNAMNRKLNLNNTSGYKGVTIGPHGLYYVRVQSNGQSVFVGAYKDIKHAARAYDIEAEKLHGEYSSTNKMNKRIVPKKHEAYGKEHRKNMSAAKKGVLNGNSSKPVLCITNKKTYLSAAQAGRDLGIDPKGISKVLRGTNKTYKSLTFKYLESI